MSNRKVDHSGKEQFGRGAKRLACSWVGFEMINQCGTGRDAAIMGMVKGFHLVRVSKLRCGNDKARRRIPSAAKRLDADQARATKTEPGC